MLSSYNMAYFVITS